MTTEVLYTTIILSLSLGFLLTSIMIVTVFMEDRTRYYIPGMVFLSIVMTFILETPTLSFAPVQLISLPIGTALSFGFFFYTIHFYTKMQSPYRP